MNFYYLINLILAERLFLLPSDRPVSLSKSIIFFIISIVFLLIFNITFSLIAFFVLLTILNAAFFLIEQKSHSINSIRIISILMNIILVGVFTSRNFSLHINEQVIYFLKSLSNHFYFLQFFENVNWLTINIILMGFMFLLKESNVIIRFIFERSSQEPKTNNSEEIDKKEYSAGRIIGALERILILFFVLNNQLAAIGFIIAAKGFTRFKELDNREFAEYVLIGTLLSASIAIAVSFLVRFLI